MSEQGAHLQTYNQELVKCCLEELRCKRGDLLAIINNEEAEEAVLQRNITVLQEKLSSIQSKLKYHKQLYSDYSRTIQETESGFMKILESSQTLLNLIQYQCNRLENNASK